MSYLICYLIAGLLIAVGSTINNRGRSGQLSRFLQAVFGWPAIVLFAPEALFRPKRVEEIPQEAPWPESTFNLNLEISTMDLAALSLWEQECVERVKKGGEEFITFFGNSINFESLLDEFWSKGVPPAAYLQLNSARRRLGSEYWIESEIRFSIREPDWYIGFSTEFVKSIAKLDKNKRARLFDALSKLSDAPTTPHGDTIKPLTGNFSGLWRYRVGDDRLIYKPDGASKKVVLISFGSRGGVYEQDI